jgi:hydrogenase maturation protease
VSDDLIDALAKTVLYEGYLLYPYRPSAVKNRQRFNFGVLYPEAFCEPAVANDRWQLQTECPVNGDAGTRVAARLRFLQLFERASANDAARPWHEALEREIRVPGTSLGDLTGAPLRLPFSFPRIGGSHSRPDSIRGEVQVGAKEITPGMFTLTVRAINLASFDPSSATREDALTQSLVSAHVVLTAESGEFVSLLDPPGAFRDVAASCSNDGVWPVLVGEEGRCDCMLASPIVLYDYPQIAPESPGDLFDGTEIDEILALRILTLTDEEKREARGADERARRILDRTDALPPEQWAKLHGAIRGLRRATEEMP